MKRLLSSDVVYLLPVGHLLYSQNVNIITVLFPIFIDNYAEFLKMDSYRFFTLLCSSTMQHGGYILIARIIGNGLLCYHDYLTGYNKNSQECRYSTFCFFIFSPYWQT